MNKSLLWPRKTTRLFRKLSFVAPNGIFATGIENSDPVVEGKRRNQLKEAHDFYENWETRLEQVNALGIKWLRFGEGYSLTHLGHDNYDFELTAKVIKKCDELGINVMIDLLHFGLPDWMHKNNPQEPYFQNPKFPYLFAEYARVFTKFFPQVKYFTIVNEPFVTARNSGLYGGWNEQKSGELNFVKAVANIAKAEILAKEAIEKVWIDEKRAGEPIFFQNDSFEKSIAGAGSSNKETVDQFNNFYRFATLDLMLGHRDKFVEMNLLKNGLSKKDYEWFMEHGNTKGIVLGIDHYPWCIHEVTDKGVVNQEPKDEYQLAAIVKEYWERYPLPLLHMEVNAVAEHAEDICQKTYKEMLLLARQGYPILGMSWFGDDLQVGWQVGLRGSAAYDEYRVGLFYKGKKEPIADIFMNYSLKGLNVRHYRILTHLYPKLARRIPAQIKHLSTPTRLIKRLIKAEN